jgi:hypothetical protein
VLGQIHQCLKSAPCDQLRHTWRKAITDVADQDSFRSENIETKSYPVSERLRRNAPEQATKDMSDEKINSRVLELAQRW